MKKNNLTNEGAIGIGLIVYIVVVGLFSILLYSTTFILALPVFIMVMPWPIIIGALVGKSLTKNRVGTWLGAVLGLFLGFWLLLLVASDMSFD